MLRKSSGRRTMKQSAVCQYSEGQKWGRMGQHYSTLYNIKTSKPRIKPHYSTLSHVNLISPRNTAQHDNNRINKYFSAIQ